jgi:hypothetical protein
MTTTAARPVEAASRAAVAARLPLLVGAAGTLLVLARLLLTGNPFRLVWSEDGLFWERAGHGLDVWAPMAGYLNAWPSALAAVGRLLPMSAFPVWAVVTSALTVGALSAFVFVAARRMCGTGPALLAAGALSLTPALRVDTLGCLNSLQWFIGPACFWALIRPWKGRLGTWSVLIAGLTGLSCAVAIVLLPVGLARRAWRATAAFAAGEAVQVAIALSERSSGGDRQHRWPSGAITAVVVYVGGAGSSFATAWLLGVLTLAAAAAAVLLARRRGDALLAVGSATALLVLTVFIAGVVPARYVAGAMMLAVFGVTLALPSMRFGRSLVVAVLVAGAVVSFPSSTIRFGGPSWGCEHGVTHVGPPQNFRDGFAC